MLHGCRECSGIPGDGRAGRGQAGGGLLRILNAAGAGDSQVAIPLVLLFGKRRFGLVGRDSCLRHLDHRLLGVNCGLLARDRRARGGDIRLGLQERDPGNLGHQPARAAARLGPDHCPRPARR